MKKRLLAMVLTVAMCLSLLPVSALAAENSAPKQSVEKSENGVNITKAVSDPDDGKYTLTMDSYVDGTATTSTKPLDIVLVLDTSGSMDDYITIGNKKDLSVLDTTYGGEDGMYQLDDKVGLTQAWPNMVYKDGKWMYHKWSWSLSGPSYKDELIEVGSEENYSSGVNIRITKMNAMKIAAQRFVDEVAAKATNSRISVVGFATSVAIKQELTSVSTDSSDIKAAIKGLSANGATRADLGMEKAKDAFGKNNTNEKVVVFFTDGVPTANSRFETSVANSAISTAKTLKGNDYKASIYTIGLMEDEDVTTQISNFMNAVSSNYPQAQSMSQMGAGSDKGYYENVTDATALNKVFDDIADIIVEPSVNADSTSVLSDTLSDYVTFAEDPNVTVKKVPASGTGDKPTWGTPEDVTGVTSKTEGKTITVTGFDYSDNAVVKDKEGKWQGYKLVVSFDVVLDTTATWTAGTNNYDTNSTKTGEEAGLTYGENSTTLDDSPEIQVTAYKVTYNANATNATGTVTDNTAYLPNATVTVKDNAFTNTGYTFTGWNTQANGEGTSYQEKATFQITGDVTLYAQWKENANVTINYKAATGGSVSNASETLAPVTGTAQGSTATASAGYTFTNWTDADGNEVSTSANFVPAKVNGLNVAATYTANFTAKNYTVKYDLNYEGATGGPADKTNVKWSDTGLLPTDTFTRDDYTFDGWYTAATNGDKVTADTKYSDLAKADTVESVTLYAHWTKNAPTTATVIFNANGGAWTDDVTGYTMGAEKKTASVEKKLTDKVYAITPAPVNGDKEFVGWGISADATDPLIQLALGPTVANLKNLTGATGDTVTLYAIWKDASAPQPDQLTYTISKHYMDETGKEVYAYNDIETKSAEKGTSIKTLISGYEVNQTYYGQTYIYENSKTTVNSVAYDEASKLTTDKTVIDLYYYLDEWNDEDDTTTGGDNTPDYQQAVINFRADPNGTVGKTGEKTTQVFTLTEGDNGKYSGSVTPSTVTPVPNDGFAFDIWTKDAGETGVAPFVAQTLNGGDNITYTAHFAADTKGGDNGNESDGIPDKYQATVTYKVVNGTWDGTSAAAQIKVFTLKTYTNGTWVDATPTPTLGDSIPTGMIANSGHTDGSWNTAIDKDTQVTGNVTYTYTFAPIGSTTFNPDDIYGKGEGEATALISKKLTGKLPSNYSEQFAVTMTKTSGPAGVTFPATGTTAAMTKTTTTEATAFVFGDGITFTAPGTYVFSVQETKGSNTSYVSYDTNPYTLTIVVDYADDTIGNQQPGNIEVNPDNPITVVGKQLEVTHWWFDVDGETQTLTIENKASYSSGGNNHSTKYTLTYETNGGSKIDSEKYTSGSTAKLTKVPTRENYTFTGWYSDKDLKNKITEIKMTSNKTVYAGWEATEVPGMLNGDDHFAYVIGYPGGDVEPMGNITRAEVATIFFRLLNDDVRDGNLTTTNAFTDVNAGDWFNTAISTMAKLGIVNGRTADTFAPNAPITRAEFATICARFDTSIDMGASNFTDLDGHWAKDDIEHAVTLGWIMGYEDGTFRPNNLITRAEAMTMINRVLCRMPESPSDLLDGMLTWPDNMDTNKWYYLAIQEATNSHDFKKKGEVNETWTKLTENPDWSRYQ